MTHFQVNSPQEQQDPPVPGAMWCKACDSWCLPSGLCRCNNR